MRATMVAESSFASRLPVVDGFEAAGGGRWRYGNGGSAPIADWGETKRHNGKAKNKAYPRVIRNS